MENITLSDVFKVQKEFSKKFFSEKKLTDTQKVFKSEEFALSLHSKITDLVKELPNGNKNLIYKTADIFRYLLSVLDVWDFGVDEFLVAFKDQYPYLRSKYEKQEWDGKSPVLIVDIDEVIANFLDGFYSFIYQKTGKMVEHANATEYYNIAGFKKAGITNSSTFFPAFIENHGFKTLEPNKDIVDVLRRLQKEGVWIQLLTARPLENPTCFYDTFHWLEQHDIPYDAIDFASEKYQWVSKEKYFQQDKVICAIDDSPKHSAEFSNHSIACCVPKYSYNQSIVGMSNIDFYETGADLYRLITEKM